MAMPNWMPSAASLNPFNWFSSAAPAATPPAAPVTPTLPAGTVTPWYSNTNTLGSMGLIGSFFGAANSAIGTYYNAKSQASSLAHSAAMAEINARISETGAQSALLSGVKEVGRLTLKGGQIKSAQKVALAANGVQMGEGSAAELVASTDLMIAIDANQIMANAVQSAWGHRTQGANYQAEALTKAAAGSSISPFGMATGSLLGSAGSVASQWYQFNKLGGTFGGK